MSWAVRPGQLALFEIELVEGEVRVGWSSYGNPERPYASDVAVFCPRGLKCPTGGPSSQGGPWDSEASARIGISQIRGSTTVNHITITTSTICSMLPSTIGAGGTEPMQSTNHLGYSIIRAGCVRRRTESAQRARNTMRRTMRSSRSAGSDSVAASIGAEHSSIEGRGWRFRSTSR
jgi:hypothetical protein